MSSKVTSSTRTSKEQHKQHVVGSFSVTHWHERKRYHICYTVVATELLTAPVLRRLEVIPRRGHKRRVVGYDNALGMNINDKTQIIVVPGGTGQKATIAQIHEIDLPLRCGKRVSDQLTRPFLDRLAGAGLPVHHNNFRLPGSLIQAVGSRH